MTFRILKLTCAAALFLAGGFFQEGQRTSQDTQWPSFRGPNASGVSSGYSLPSTWNLERGENIQWKTSIPGLGLSSPVVWGERVFLSSAIGGSGNAKLKTGLYGNVESVNDDTVHRWIVYCVDRRTGRIVREKTAIQGIPKVKRHPKSTHANSTLATDGKHVVAFFGSEGIYCYDVAGNLLWAKDLGLLDSGFFVAPSAQWEFGSSPIIYKNMVIVQCDVQKGSFLAALNVEDGSEMWRTPRDDVPTWSTPAVYVSGSSAQVVVNGYKHIGGYDAYTGKELWRMEGGGDIPVPTPVVSRDMVYITGAHGRSAPIYAIRLAATGDISLRPGSSSNGAIAWSVDRDGSYMATPIVYGEYLYNFKWNGVVSCYESRSGKRLFQERLGGGTSAFTSSPVAGDGQVYIAGEEGDVYVIKAGPEFKLLAQNSLSEVCMATPAISARMLIFRTQSHLIGISEPSSRQAVPGR